MSLIEDITASTRRYTLHSHTQWCDGRATVDQFARAAVAAGMKHYGFSPHSPVPIVSNCNMSESDVATYLAEVDRLNKIYAAEGIRFYKSMEIDFLGAHWGPHSPYFHRLPLDYRIGSVHFIPAQDGTLVDIDGRYESFRRKMSANFHGDLSWVVNTFFDQSEKMIRLGGFDMIGHLDKVVHNASLHQPGIDREPWVEERVARIIDMAVANGVAIEINTKAWAAHHRMFPDPKWWGRLKEMGAIIAVNSDAHQPELIDASREEAFRLLDV